MKADWEGLLQLAATQHGVIHRIDARSHGIDAQRLRRAVAKGHLRRELSDVFTVAGSTASWHQRLRVATAADATVSHRAAAALHQLDGFGPGLVEVTFERNHQRGLPGAVVHRWSNNEPADVTVVDGIAVTSVARTLVQLGSVVEPSKVEQALDDALRRGTKPAWIVETLERLHRRGPTGAHVLRSLLDDPTRVGASPDSHFERLLQRLLDIPGLPRPKLQHEVVLSSGQRRRLDLAYPDVRLGVEAHSHRWHASARDWHADQQRNLELAGRGWTLLHVTWPMLRRPAETVDLVARRYWQLKASSMTS